MTDLPNEIMVWHSMEKLTHIGTWATERYPGEAVAYVPLADAQAAQAMVVEKAADAVKSLWKWDDEGWQVHRPTQSEAEAAIRNLADIDGLALVRELRDRAEKAEADTRRLVVAATNPSGQKCNARRATGLTHCADPFNCGGMVDYKVDEAIETVENLLSAWKAARIERDRLADANAVLEAKVATMGYVLQEKLHNRLVPRVVDIAYSAFMSAKRPNKEDGGPSDWFTDTRPMVMEKIEEIRAALRGKKETS